MSFATEDKPGPGTTTATATDRRVAAATSTTTVPAGDHPHSGQETVTAA